MENITLIGMPGSGKSTVGVLLAKALGYQFLDTDLVIQEREGGLLQDLLNRMGQEAFLDAECKAICSVETGRTVIAPGGSCIYRAEAMEHLKKLGKVIYIEVTLPELERRLTNISTRGIAMGPGETLADLYQARTPLYQNYADVTIRSDGQTLEETVAAVRNEIKECNA